MTGVQTCALPIYVDEGKEEERFKTAVKGKVYNGVKWMGKENKAR